MHICMHLVCFIFYFSHHSVLDVFLDLLDALSDPTEGVHERVPDLNEFAADLAPKSAFHPIHILVQSWGKKKIASQAFEVLSANISSRIFD